MHVAICDDNVADRKHLERLLSRESDKRAGTPNILYIESFGNKYQFLRNPLKYNIVFMDMTSTPTLTLEIIEELTRIGFKAPIVLFSSVVDYKLIENLPDNIIHCNKPYTKEPLEDLLKLGDKHVEGHIEAITVHYNGNPIRIPKDEILYCNKSHGSNYFEITLTTGEVRIVDEQALDLQLLVERYYEFVRITKKVIINVKFITMLTPLSVMMQDHKIYRYSPLRYRGLKEKRLKADRLS